VKKITINDYQRGLKFVITDHATIAGLNRITDIIDRMEATAEVMERSGTHHAVLLAASYHEQIAYTRRHCPKATNGSTVARANALMADMRRQRMERPDRGRTAGGGTAGKPERACARRHLVHWSRRVPRSATRLTETASVPGPNAIGPDHPERQQPHELARPRCLAGAALVVLLFVLVAAEQSLNPFHHGVDGACCFVFGCAFCDVAEHFG
jgi:hypothetical protein